MAHLQVLVEANSMGELVSKCNLISLTTGISFEFKNYVHAGKKFYCTYYVDLEDHDVFRKVSAIERSKNNRPK